MRRRYDLSQSFEISMKEEASLLQLARAAFADAFPNPQRFGCPDRSLRADLASGKRDLRQHWEVFDHICQCSPCFVEHLTFRKQRRRRIFGISVCLFIAVLVSLVGAYAKWNKRAGNHLLADAELRRSIPHPPEPPAIAFARPILAARLDFTHWSLQRGGADSSLPPPPLRRGNLSVTIYLPIATPPGDYRIVLRRNGAPPLIDAILRARIANGNTILTSIGVDTSSVSPGTYRLTARRLGASVAREFFVRLE